MPDLAAWLEAEWDGPENVLAGCTTCLGGRSGGVWQSNNVALHVGDDPEAVEANRLKLAGDLNARGLQWLTQVHGNVVHQADMGSLEFTPEADAAWTNVRGLALAIMTADCVPIVLADDGGSVVGAAHAGWQGLRWGVVAALVNALAVSPASLSGWIGPAISGACYEVGADVWQAFATDHAAALSTHPHDADKRLLNLSQVAQAQLFDLGVRRVRVSDWCTYSDARFYSHRRAQHAGQASTGRIATVIMLQ